MKLLFSILFSAFFGTVAWADWHTFRGPDATGQSADARSFSVAEDSIVWAADLPGEGVGSPVIVGDRLYVSASSGPHQDQLHVLCFSVADGSLLWERQFWATGRVMHHKKTAVAAPSLVTDGARIFAHFSSNDLLCLDLEGNLEWLRGLTLDYPNASNSLGLASSPAMAGDVLIVQVENDSQSFAAGIDSKTGINLWKVDRTKKANWSSPVIYAGTDGKPIVVLQGSAGLDAVDPRTGDPVWSFENGASTSTSTAVGSDGRLYVPSNGLTVLQPGEASVPATVWLSDQLSPGTSSPVVRGGLVYVVTRSSILTSASTEDGERLWRLRLQGPISSSPVIAGRNLYVVSENGLLQQVDLDAPEGEVVGTLDLAETILATPALSHGSIFLRSDHKLWRIGKP